MPIFSIDKKLEDYNIFNKLDSQIADFRGLYLSGYYINKEDLPKLTGAVLFKCYPRLNNPNVIEVNSKTGEPTFIETMGFNLKEKVFYNTVIEYQYLAPSLSSGSWGEEFIFKNCLLDKTQIYLNSKTQVRTDDRDCLILNCEAKDTSILNNSIWTTSITLQSVNSTFKNFKLSKLNVAESSTFINSNFENVHFQRIGFTKTSFLNTKLPREVDSFEDSTFFDCIFTDFEDYHYIKSIHTSAFVFDNNLLLNSKVDYSLFEIPEYFSINPTLFMRSGFRDYYKSEEIEQYRVNIKGIDLTDANMSQTKKVILNYVELEEWTFPNRYSSSSGDRKLDNQLRKVKLFMGNTRLLKCVFKGFLLNFNKEFKTKEHERGFWTNCEFNDCSFDRAYFNSFDNRLVLDSSCVFQNTVFVGCSLNNYRSFSATFTDCEFTSNYFTNVTFAKATFSKCLFSDNQIRNCEFKSCTFDFETLQTVLASKFLNLNPPTPMGRRTGLVLKTLFENCSVKMDDGSFEDFNWDFLKQHKLIFTSSSKFVDLRIRG